MRRQGRYPLTKSLHLGTLLLEFGHQTLIGGIIGDEQLEMSESLFWVGGTEEGLVLLERGNGGGGGRRRRRAVEIELGVVILLVNLDRRGLRLYRTLNDREVGLDGLDGRLIFNSEDGAEALAGERLGVDGVDRASRKFGDGKDLGLLVVERGHVIRTPVVGVQVEHGDVERSLRDKSHANLGVVGLRRHAPELLVLVGVEVLASGGRGGRRGGRRQRRHSRLGVNTLLA